MKLVHHHLIYQAVVGKDNLGVTAERILKKFLRDLAKEIGMQVLIPPQTKFSNQKAWSGLIGIITSHIAFHFWTVERYVQLDIYSCKRFDKRKAIAFLNDFWDARDMRAMFIDREVGKDFTFKKISP